MIKNTAPGKNISYSATARRLGERGRFGTGLSYSVNDFINAGIDFDYLNTSISKKVDSSFYQVKQPGGIDYRYMERYSIAYKTWAPFLKLFIVNQNI
ncbi:MAG: hypothetical protein WDO19_28540 [Bacteroidota bacterium]